jgi:hypothetical protein
MTEDEIKKRYELLSEHLDERSRRLLVAAEALALGYGGQTIVARATNVSRDVIRDGLKELQSSTSTIKNEGRIRKPGGGRKKTIDKDPSLRQDLEALIEPLTRGDPETPLRWTCKSTRQLASELIIQGHSTSHRMVADILHELNYSLQANKKTHEGKSHPDRNEQFEYISKSVINFQSTKDPVISVDAKKKELVGNFKNNGREWHPKGSPEEVNVYDFKSLGEGIAIPYGVYDLTMNTGWVSVGIDHDTSSFAVESIRCWWNYMGKETYPNAKRLLITADGGGSNGSRVKLWKAELQKFATEIRIPITVNHLPPCTSKWNKIEHRLFSYISQNWRGKPLISYEVIVNLIASTTTNTGLKVKAALNTGSYPKGIKITEKDIKKLKIVPHDFHSDWNYTILPERAKR